MLVKNCLVFQELPGRKRNFVSQGFVSDIVIKAFWSVGNFLAVISPNGWFSSLNYSYQKLF